MDIYQEDALTWLKKKPAESVDLIVTDPPYESLEEHRGKGVHKRLQKWFPIIKTENFIEIFREFYRVLKKNTHCYVFCDHKMMFLFKPMGEMAGFTFWKPLIWNKCRTGMGYHYRASYEVILFFEKGKRNLSNWAVRDVFSVLPDGCSYPTQKPEELLRELIRNSSEQGELVIDPFMGSGSTGLAALMTYRKFAGTDISPEAYALTYKRMSEIIPPILAAVAPQTTTNDDGGQEGKGRKRKAKTTTTTTTTSENTSRFGVSSEPAVGRGVVCCDSALPDGRQNIYPNGENSSSSVTGLCEKDAYDPAAHNTIGDLSS